MMEIRRITDENRGALRLKNEPFPLIGRLVPSYTAETWSWREELRPAAECSEMCFPDEPYDFDAMAAEYTVFGAFEGETCIGLVLLKSAWFKYMYVEDLKVNRADRCRGVGKALMDAAMAEAVGRGYRGLYLIAQDNNLVACRFYLGLGYRIGGFDNQVYRGTSQDGTGDIYFYRDA